MGVKVTTKSSRIPKMQKSVKVLDGLTVKVGCIEGKHTWLARIHEYGCKIKVTDKMRKYLASQGLYLRKETTEIVIPERAFLRNGYKEGKKEALQAAKDLTPDVLFGTLTAEELAEIVGTNLSSAIKDYARDLSDPPNHPFTIQQKGSSNPLADTGDMINGITYAVDKKG